MLIKRKDKDLLKFKDLIHKLLKDLLVFFKDTKNSKIKGNHDPYLINISFF